MAKHIMVAGDANQFVMKLFENVEGIEITDTYKTIDEVIEQVIKKGVANFSLVKSICVLDFAFENTNREDRLIQFNYLQYVMKKNSMKKTKLYMVTKDVDLYRLCEENDRGTRGIHYVHAEVLLLEGNYEQRVMADILRGSEDRRGLYHTLVDELGVMKSDEYKRQEVKDRKDYIVVAGDANEYVLRMMERRADINIKKMYDTVGWFVSELEKHGVGILDGVSRVLVMDYGFETSEPKVNAGKFMELQNAMHGVRESKLNLVTKDREIYKELSREVDGINGVRYRNTEVLLIEGEYGPKLLEDIFKGKRDKTGLYHTGLEEMDKETNGMFGGNQ